MTDHFNDEEFHDASTKKKSRKKLWCCLSAFLVPVLVVALAVGGYMYTLRDAYEKDVDYVDLGIDDPASTATKGEGTNILLLGSDKRDPNSEEAKTVKGQRSDVMMLVHISADHQHAYVSSFPRDLYVPIPGHGKDRINAALAFGGVPLSVKTVQEYVGVKIDHVALIDFQGVEGLVDELGGVDVHVSETFVGDGVQYTKGVQTMNGKDALTFVRQRKQLSGGDFARNANQRALLQGIVQKIISRGTLTDPGKIVAMTQQISPYLTVDSKLTSDRIVQLGLENRGLRSGNIRYLSVPHGDPFTTKGGASVVGTDDAGMAKFSKAIKEDDMENYVSQNG